MAFNAPLYVSIWLISIFLSGGYDRPFRIGKMLRGMFLGLILTTAIYGLLNADYRHSRAVLIMGAAWAAVSATVLRSILGWWQYGSILEDRDRNKNLLILGNQEESQRVLQLLQQAQVYKNVIGTVSPTPEKASKIFIGYIHQLEEIAAIYKVEEIIFCSKDISSEEIITWMTRLGNTIDYKILPEHSLSIIGSNSKNTAGDLYTVDIQFRISAPESLRNKRLLDISLAILIMVSLPLWLFSKNAARWINNIFPVLLGKKTWVGYYPLPFNQNNITASNLPKLKKGVFAPVEGLSFKPTDPDTLERLNLFYAKDYSLINDVTIRWRNI
jgi:hypothetical protein